MAEGSRDWLRLPVVTAGSEHLVMGHLMRRNILTYKAPPGNEGYDLICIHPDPRHQPGPGEKAQIRVQVKSRYATDCDRGFPVKEKSLDAVGRHHEPSSTWEKVRLKKQENEIEPFKNEEGFEQIATALGVSRPQKIR
jgi:hypothetical protein